MRTWLRRYQQEGKPGLQERSRAPHRIPHKTPPEVEQRVLQARDAIPCFGPRRLKQEFDLPCSTGAIGRILQHHGRSRRRKKPRRPARSLAAAKSAWRPFGLLQIDVKDLSDLAGYRELIPFGLPRYQYTGRIVPEGAIWLAFSAVNDSTYALLFADRLLEHLRRCGLDLSQLVVQTDNGSEFGGNWNRRHGLPPPSPSWWSRNTAAGGAVRRIETWRRCTASVRAAVPLARVASQVIEPQLIRPRLPKKLRAARAPWVQARLFALMPVMLSSLSAQDLPLPRQILGQDVPGYVTY